MSDLIVLPTVLPALTAAFLLLAVRYDLKRQRVISVAATAGLLALAIVLYGLASDGVPRPYRLGDWPAPFGIVLVLDRLSATMLVLAAALALCVVLYAVNGWDARGRHFHPLFQFQLLGINGAFLTGDVFNLFVFFEVMLIASYGLLLHGGGPRRLRAGFQYVAINLLASTLFLFAVGLIYAVVGTLNMADLAVKAPLVGPSDAALLRTGVLLLFLVFAIKAALVPLHWWLPATYAAASAPAAALFMIMTKIGVYAMLRVYGTVFGAAAGPLAGIVEPWILPAALATVVIGSDRHSGEPDAARPCCLCGRRVDGHAADRGRPLRLPAGVTTALYYLVHSTLSGAALFLLVDLIAERRGRMLDRLVPAGEIANPNLLGGLFLLGAIAIVGLPPLSGFIGKLMILDASRGADAAPWVWSIVLGMTLVMVLGFARAGSAVFWNIDPEPRRARSAGRRDARVVLPLAVAGLLIAATAALAALRRAGDAGTEQQPPSRRSTRKPMSAPCSAPPCRRRPRQYRSDRAMARLVPHPHLSVLLALVWILLANEIDTGTVLLAAVLGIAVPLVTSVYWSRRPRIGAPFVAVAYALIVLWDIVVANIQVAYLVLFRRGDRLRSQFRHDPARRADAGSDRGPCRDDHDDPRHGQRRSQRRRPRAARPLSRHRRPGGDGGRDKAPLRTPAAEDFRMIVAACAIALVAVALAMLLTLYRLFRGPDIVDRVLALDTLVIDLIALIVLAGNPSTARRCISRRRCCSRWSGLSARSRSASSCCAATSSNERTRCCNGSAKPRSRR